MEDLGTLYSFTSAVPVHKSHGLFIFLDLPDLFTLMEYDASINLTAEWSLFNQI